MHKQGKTNRNMTEVEKSSGLTCHIAKTSLPTSQNVSWTYWTITAQNLTNCARHSTEIQWKLAAPVQEISLALSAQTARN